MSVEELRAWLAIDDGELSAAKDLRKRAIDVSKAELGRRITGWTFKVKESHPTIREHESGQSLSPCVDVNGDETEAYPLKAGVLHLTAAVADAPTNWACDQQPSNRLMHYGKTSQDS